MKVHETGLREVLLIEPRVFEDTRGFFYEMWNEARYAEAGVPRRFAQDNLSYSMKGTLRGLHYQCPRPQGKLVHVIEGEVFDVAVDIRRGSRTYAEWVGVTLSAANKRQLYVPPGFAHGFCVLSDIALFAYKCTEFYEPSADRGLAWNDPDVGIDWPVRDPLLSAKDNNLPLLSGISSDALPVLTESV